MERPHKHNMFENIYHFWIKLSHTDPICLSKVISMQCNTLNVVFFLVYVAL